MQTAACEGVSKLLLTGALTDDDVLKSLVLTYYSPDTASNQPLRQCLSYFLPLYCSSHAKHQRMIQRIFMDVWDLLTQVYAETEAQLGMIAPAQIALQLADWSNPEKLLLSTPDETVHADLLHAILERLCTMDKGTSHD